MNIYDSRPRSTIRRYVSTIDGPGCIIAVHVEAKSRPTCQLMTELIAMKVFVDARPTMLLKDKVTGAEWQYSDKRRGKGSTWRRL
jgi:hypothetical protein